MTRVFGVVGACAAKSGLVPKLVAELTGRGLRVSTIKHVPDELDLDRPGTGSWAQREAGAEEIILASGTRHLLMRELRRAEDEPDVDELIARLSPVDIVLLEGFRLSPYPKLEAVRAGQDRRLLALDDPSVLAVASDAPMTAPVPWLALGDVPRMANFVIFHAAGLLAHGLSMPAPGCGAMA